MLKYFLRRLLAMIPKLIIISLVVFFALQLLPGDAVTRSVSPDVYRNMTPEQLDALRESLGLNDPLLVQYLRWVRNILRGEFGYSQATGANIAGMLAARLPATIRCFPSSASRCRSSSSASCLSCCSPSGWAGCPPAGVWRRAATAAFLPAFPI